MFNKAAAVIFSMLMFMPSAFSETVTIEEPKDIYQISIDELLKTEAAQNFQAGDFEKALEEFQVLAQT